MDHDALYREVGEALHLAQTFEFNICTLISIMNNTTKLESTMGDSSWGMTSAVWAA